MIENYKRGGLCFVCPKRHAKENVTHVGERDESSKESSDMIDVDAGNLHRPSLSESCSDTELKFQRI
jgi:hypothetical protein